MAVVTLYDMFYQVNRDWIKLPAGWQLADVSSVTVNERGTVFVLQRSSPPIVVLDEGRLLASWGEHKIVEGHGIAAHEDRVVVVDRGGHCVHIFTDEGQLVATTGTPHRPVFTGPFNHPAAAAIAPWGDLYVADGYGNSLVHRFSSGGEHLMSWGGPGPGTGEFTTPHGIAIDRTGNILVADRENHRVQAFDGDGAFQYEWGDFSNPMDIHVDATGTVFVSDQVPRVSALGPEGALLGRCQPVPYAAHGLAGDSRGRLYLAEPAPVDRITRLDPLERLGFG